MFIILSSLSCCNCKVLLILKDPYHGRPNVSISLNNKRWKESHGLVCVVAFVPRYLQFYIFAFKEKGKTHHPVDSELFTLPDLDFSRAG